MTERTPTTYLSPSCAVRTAVVILSLILVALALTNPGYDRFEEFVDDTVVTIVQREASGQAWGGLVGELGGALAGRLARNSASRSNYLVVSVYSIDMAPVGMPGQEWRFLGIANTFIEIDRPDQLR